MRKKKVKYGNRTHQSRERFKAGDNSLLTMFPDITIRENIFEITGYSLYLVNRFMPGKDKKE